MSAFIEGDCSKVEVERVGGRSRLTRCLSIAPLKILTPNAGADYCTAVLSSYGGGLVAGDQVRLSVDCGREAKLFLGTQAFTKVYKTVDGQGARQEIAGRIGPGGCVVSLPDPVVPYADSAFVQEQVWRLEEGATLILLDAATAGRGARGERFQYSSYTSNITIYRGDDLVLVERFNSQPSQQKPDDVGVFAGSAAFANVFVVGSCTSASFGALREVLAAELQPRVAKQFAMGVENGRESAVFVSLAAARPGVLVARILGPSSEDLDFVTRALALAVSHPKVLAGDPLRRKY